MHVFAEVASETTGTGLALKQVKDMPQRVFGCVPQSVTAFHIGQELFGNSQAAGNGVVVAKYHPVCLGQKIGVLVGLATNHDAIHFPHVFVYLIQCLYAAVKDDFDVRKGLLDGIGALIDQRRDIPVFLGGEAGKDRLAGMDGQAGAAGGFHAAHKPVKEIIVILVIDADTGFHRHRYADRRLHGFDTARHQLRLGHQNRADLALLNPVGWAAHIQIDLVIAVVSGDAAGLGQLLWVAATQLQGHGVLFVVETQETVTIAVQNGLGYHHFGVQQRMPGDQAGQKPVVPCGPVHHRGDAQAAVQCAGCGVGGGVGH